MNVSVNSPKTSVTEKSNGIAAATVPNVCKMPGPPTPFVPMPLPNIGRSGESPKDYSSSVTIGGAKVAIRGATFGSEGDAASKGTGGGIVSNSTQGPTSFAGLGAGWSARLLLVLASGAFSCASPAPSERVSATTAAPKAGVRLFPEPPKMEPDPPSPLLQDMQGLTLEVPNRLLEPPLASVTSLPSSSDLLSQATKGEGGKLWVARSGHRAYLTLDVGLHRALQDTLRRGSCLYSAAVAIQPQSGRVLAMAEHSQAKPDLRGLTTRAVFPAASVFKVITTAALLREGVSPDDATCSHGGGNAITRDQLVDSPLDRECYTLTQALGRSINATFAKLTFKYLDATRLRQRAEALHFNRPFSFPIPTDVSLASFSGGPVAVSAAGAGFGNVFLSPLHGAAIASTLANGGVWREPVLFEEDLAAAPEEALVMSPQEARELVEMMATTVTRGTARRSFGEDGERLDAIGKTGTLSDVAGRQYSWFIGFASKDDPQIAIAVVTVNGSGRRAPAARFGREAMLGYMAALASAGR